MSAAGVIRNKWFFGLVALLVLGSVGLKTVVNARIADTGVSQDMATFPARRGPLTISVTVAGTIKPMDQVVLKCEVEGTTTILYIVPEGENVKKGDLLVELDSSRLEDLLVDEEIRVFNAEAALVSAKESLAVIKNQAESDIDRAKLDYQFAQEDHKNYLEGTYPQSLRSLESKITLADATAKRTETELEGSKRLFEKNFITATELEADKQQALKAKIDLELANRDMKLLTDFTYTRTLAELESDVKQTKMALERVERRAAADIMAAEANLKARELEFGRQTSKLDKTKENVDKTRIVAPRDGVVVYATSGRGGGGGRRRGGPNIEPLEEGQNVRERQELIHMPTTTDFMCEVTVHEASLSKVRVGLPVRITVDALRGKTFWGRVSYVAPLPDARSSFMNPDLKLYATDIVLESDTTGLRTGMSCHGEIIVKEHEDTIYVPVQSVVRENGKPTVYVNEENRVVSREVEIGLDNNRMIRIAKGLDEDELVLLAPPLSESGDDDGNGEDVREKRPEGMDIPAEDSGAKRGVAGPAGTGDGSPPRGGEGRPGGDGPGGPRGAGTPGGDRERGGRGGGFSNLSEEERAQRMQERMQDMSPEEREEFQQRRLERQQSGGRAGGGREGRPRGPGRGDGGGQPPAGGA